MGGRSSKHPEEATPETDYKVSFSKSADIADDISSTNTTPGALPGSEAILGSTDHKEDATKNASGNKDEILPTWRDITPENEREIESRIEESKSLLLSAVHSEETEKSLTMPEFVQDVYEDLHTNTNMSESSGGPRERIEKEHVVAVQQGILSYKPSLKSKRPEDNRPDILHKAKDLIEIPQIAWTLNSFPFLMDTYTIDHLRKSRVMFLMRGLPGSGKSTIVRQIIHIFPDALVASADDLFLTSDGSYKFDASKLSIAHEQCQKRVEAACRRATPVVVVDNTNVRQWEMKSYTSLASQHNYTVVLVEPRTSWKWNPVELARRNKHGVAVDVLRKKVGMYDEVYPTYYGWFLNVEDSRRLLELCQKFFKICVGADETFASSITQSSQEERASLNMNMVYGRERSSTETLHCTSFFSNRGRTRSASAYSQLPAVKAALGKVTSLHIIGVLFTRNTVGARVQLTDEQLKLWDKDDAEGLRELCHQSPTKSGTVSDSPTGSSPSSTRSNGLSQDQQKNESASRFNRTEGFGSRAHVTIGYRADSSAVQTGLDMVRVIELESQHDGPPSYTTVESAALCHYGNDEHYWMVYLDVPIVFNALFSGKY